MYFDIAPAIPLPSGRDLFTYESSDTLSPGTIVRVPFGARKVNGVVIQKVGKKPPYKTKSIIRAYPAALTPEQLALGVQLAALALGGFGFTLRLFFPPSLRASLPAGRQRARSALTPKTEALIASRSNRIKRLETHVKRTLKNGGQVLVLVPERWMTARFPFAKAFHAGLNVSQAQPVWDEVASGKPVAIVGTQKALFLPWRNLCLTVVDEEQLPTHKIWDGYPRGDNRRLVQLAQAVHRARVILSGPTPSLQLYHRVRQQKQVADTHWKPATPKYTILPFSFGDRRHGRLVPEDFVVALRSLKQDKKRVLILHNQKDGTVAKALRSLRLLKKHQIVIGTNALFAKLGDQQFDAVVWMFPESALAAPDFRSRERGYLLLTRLSGLLASSRRAVTLVTRQPSFVDKSFSGSLTQIYKEMLAERKKYTYPPYADMVKLTLRSRSQAEVTKRTVTARQTIEKHLVDERDHIRVLGPYGPKPAKGSKQKPQKNLLLLGDITSLPTAYRTVLPDTVDIDPERVI